MKNRKLLIILVAALLVGAVAYFMQNTIKDRFFEPTGSSLQQGISAEDKVDIKTVAEGLTVPWEVTHLQGSDILVTERSGILRRVGADRQSHKVEGVVHAGEGGLLGLALHPEFKRNGWIYLYMTTQSGSSLVNRIERYTYKDSRLESRKIILKNIPGASNHDGGRITFGPDGYLYATTGDAGNEDNAQNINSLAGKILRMNEEGKIPVDNPFKNYVYSYGHRNPQGLAWDNKGQLWSTEHGRSGLQSGYDELNLIRKGHNYGWPLIQGDEESKNKEKPVAHSGPDETWAPASLAYAQGSLFFGGLRGESLYEAKISRNNSVSIKAHFKEEFGRLRAVSIGPNNFMYITTSNTDGRGDAKPSDDKVIRVRLSAFK